MDFEKMSDDELRAFLNAPVQAAQERQAVERAQEAQPKVDTTMGMSGPELALAGAGRELMQVPRGLYELGVGAFGSPSDIEKYNKEKSEQRKIDDMLMSNWQAKAGAFGSQAAIAAAAPARLGAQAGLSAILGALSPTKGDISGMELPSRAVQGGEAGLATTVVGAPLGVIGKKIGALTGKYTPENQAMVEAGRAARRLGIIPTTGAMMPGGGARGIEAGSSWYPEHVAEQGRVFASQAGKDVPVASATLGKTTTRNIPGEALRESITSAGEKMSQQGSKMWNSLDDYVRTNNLPAVIAKDTQDTVRDIATKYSPRNVQGNVSLRNNEVFSYIERADKAGDVVADRFKNMLSGKKVATPSFSELHEMQTVVGRALSRARYDAGARNAPRSADDAVNELGRLYKSISDDVDRWTTTNPTAGKMFQQAKSYWRDTVVPNVINNDLYQKASKGSLGTSNRGYDEPRQFFSDVINKPEEAKALYPTMDQKGRDLITSMHLMPDMSGILTAAKTQPVAVMTPEGKLLSSGVRAPEMFGNNLNNVSRAIALTKPGIVREALGHLPFSKRFGTSQGRQERLLAEDAFKNSPLGRAAWAGLQKPKEDIESWEQGLRLGR